jgi:hypothetical protein
LGLREGLRGFQRRNSSCAAFLSYGHFAPVRSFCDRSGRGFRKGWDCSLHNASPLKDVVPVES